MAGSLAALKSLPCPAGDQCSAFQCLFKHDRDGDTAPDGKGLARSSSEITTTSLPDQASSRKRIKLDPSTSTPSGKQITDQIPTAGKKPQSSTNGADSGHGTRDSGFELSSTQHKVTSLKTGESKKMKLSPRPAPKKAEALNPRLLKSSPAKHATRLILIKALHEQYVRLNNELKKDKDAKRLVLSDQELIVKALDDEQEIATRKFQIYGNAIKNRILSHKKKTIAEWKAERSQAMGDNKTNDTENASAAPQPINTGLTPSQEVDFALRLVYPFDNLTDYGYVSSIPSDEDIEKAREGVKTSGNVEVCDRCTRRFQVFPGRREEDGTLASNGSCTFHPGKIYYTERGPGKGTTSQKKYRCCHRNVDDDAGGCTTASTHVFKTTDVNRLAGLLNFAQTPPNPNVPADRAVCFDCEMGYTVYGMELIRVTALSWPNYEMLLDVLVQPFGEVLDLNTRYSGVTPEDMVSAKRWQPGDDHLPLVNPSTTSTSSDEREKRPKLKIVSSPKAARDLLFSLIAPTTPIIGHGLENDLNAMRIIHPTCIDTVLLYPHKRTLPARNSLKMLTETLLNRKIQKEIDESNPQGHDSAEDAKAAGELVRLKIRDEWKALCLRGWIIQDGKITLP
ncbi:uncharacterized protein GGS25DRAFT_533000 [Hypoxylon fragiforme]|uniref:uncharacterized protein n=1 Tax=Hypoxylon fragiforme TaxID=63214 RepID=UPI0020C60DE1|nr:uncharacterized protein GGS25DRAFT_533000 [Hypoxylon fragiforme]KAI2605779.1 hypothetical protein GGS25DRAFT_533000 [Hypoxylon fragiforme]